MRHINYFTCTVFAALSCTLMFTLLRCGAVVNLISCSPFWPCKFMWRSLMHASCYVIIS